MKHFPQLKAAAGLFLAAVIIVAGALPVLYFAALGVSQLFLSVQSGRWVALPLSLAFSDHDLLAAARAAPLLPFIPEFPWVVAPPISALLDRVHVALIPALAGLAFIAAGMLRIRRIADLRRLYRQKEEDRVRRVQDYQREEAPFIDGRREPFISNRRAA